MDCSYCNGEMRHGSRKKTPYIVGISSQPRLIAHAMQQPPDFRVRKDEGGENRESSLRLTEPEVQGNEL